MQTKLQSFSYDFVRLLPQEQIELHQQSSWEVTLIVNGSGMKFIGDTAEAFQQGEVVIIPPEIPHCWYFNHDDTNENGQIVNITVSFTDDFLARCASSFPELAPSVKNLKNIHEALKYNPSQAERIKSFLQLMLNQNEVERLSTMIQLLAVLAHPHEAHIVSQYKQIDKKQERLNRVRVFVICNAHRNISLDDIVRHVGMNKTAFCAFFKRATGKTFVSYLNAYRIELACQLLKQPNKSISEIGYHVGFTDIPYFNRVFKKEKGCSPSEYRLSQAADTT